MRLLPAPGDLMRRDLAAIVCCPVHKSALKLEVTSEDEHGDIQSGTLRCTTCRFDYPIRDGIPNLLPPEYHLDEVKDAPTAPAKSARGNKGKAKA